MMKIFILFLFFSFAINNTYLFAQAPKDSLFNEMGVSVSPSSMHLSVKPGTSLNKDITVKNDTKKTYQFQVGYSDFEMGTNGKPTQLKPADSKYGLSKWLTVSPSYFELKPGAEIKLRMILAVPDDESALSAAWTIITIEQSTEREPLDKQDVPKRLSMGIIPSFGFGVYVYQNPPNVKINQLEITNLKFIDDEKGKKVFMEASNTGDGISYCTSYLEVTNLSNGEQKKLQAKMFTILPKFKREFYYDLTGLSPGKYSSIGVIDYGNKEELVAAELEFEIK